MSQYHAASGSAAEDLFIDLFADAFGAEKAGPQPENAGKPWTEEDEEILSRMFDTGCTKKEICNHFQRSQGAIAARLVRLGKIRDRYEFR